MSDPTDKNSKKNVIVFSLILSVICSLLITVSAVGLKDLQDANMKLDKRINILKAVNLITENKSGKTQINNLYDQHIKEVIVNRHGEILDTPASDSLQLYFYQKKEQIKGYIIPINTQGLWGKIQGYLAFETDGQTVLGFSVFSHSETPGLGGEIESAWFTKNFEGKKILNSQDKFVSVGVAKGKVSNLPEDKRAHFVDGISGATLTGNYLSQGIENTLIKYDKISVSFRQKQLKPQKKNTQAKP